MSDTLHTTRTIHQPDVQPLGPALLARPVDQGFLEGEVSLVPYICVAPEDRVMAYGMAAKRKHEAS